jgi:hypothetical protein
MFQADWVVATGTSGSGSFTLTALSPYANFNEPFGNTGAFLCWYSATDGAGAWEAGYGTLTLGTGNTSTLTRTPLETRTAAGVYTRGAPAALVFATAPQVRYAPLANRYFPAYGPLYNDGNWRCINQTDQLLSGTTLITNTIIRGLLNWNISVPVSAIGVYVTTTAAGSMRFSLYRMTSTGDAGARVFDSGVLSTAAGGLVGVTTTLYLPVGTYYLDINSDNSSAQISASSATDPNPVWGPIYFENNARTMSKAVTFAAPADPAPSVAGFSSLPPNTNRVPAIFVKA